ncbi:hypothetical protein HNP82_001262 [Catenibacillus scindens]|uniref:DUF4214 domain-containing protein n=1 Tax=Catenibacillus scindens TaxID=673271 RepID=A0A7W8M550_9FIRM|nr:DUF4214 domain-containing protein [Catenibacillus scindens]MBB5264157.1 hypothetical protein [Catenibacillus scindens]
MKLKKLAITLITTSLIMGINGIPAMAAENTVINENVSFENLNASSTADALRQKQWVVDKEAVYKTVHHDAEGYYKDEKVVDKEAVYEDVLVSPEEGHWEQQKVIDKEAVYDTVHHEAEGYWTEKEWVETKPAWDEPIYEEQIRQICVDCGMDLTEMSADDRIEHAGNHLLADPDNASGQWRDEVHQVQTGSIHHDAEGYWTEPVWVETKPAWDETVLVSPEESHMEDVWVVDKEAVYEQQLVTPEVSHIEKVWVETKPAYDEEVLVSPEEGHYEYVYIDSVAEFVNRLYTNLLQREADDSGLVSWTEVLKSGREQGVKVAQGFVESNEFKSRTLSDTEYIKILYRTFLGREADTNGLNSWLAVLDSGLSRMHVFKGFAESDEFTKICQQYGIQRGNAVLTAPMDQNEGVTKFVARCYELCLGRKADADGLNAWCNQILTGANTPKQAAYGFVFSNEFKAKNLSDTEYVKVLYRVFMDREGDAGGLNAWVNVLKSGQSREHVFNGFADSPEFQEICAGYGLLNR